MAECLAMPEVHQPANPKNSDDKATKAVSPVTDPFTIRTLGNNSQNDAGEQGKEDGSFKVIQTELWH